MSVAPSTSLQSSITIRPPLTTLSKRAVKTYSVGSATSRSKCRKEILNSGFSLTYFSKVLKTFPFISLKFLNPSFDKIVSNSLFVIPMPDFFSKLSIKFKSALLVTLSVGNFPKKSKPTISRVYWFSNTSLNWQESLLIDQHATQQQDVTLYQA